MTRMLIVLFFLVIPLGCAVSIWPPAFSFGGSSIRTDCKKTGWCESVVESEPVGVEVLDFLARIIDAVPGAEVAPASTTPSKAPNVIYVHPEAPARTDDITLDDWDNTLTIPNANLVEDCYPECVQTPYIGPTRGWTLDAPAIGLTEIDIGQVEDD